MSTVPSVLALVNLVRVARGLDPVPAIDLRGTKRGTTDECPLATALGCEVAGACEPGEFAMHFVSLEDAVLVESGTGWPRCRRHAEVVMPRELGDLVVSFESGLVIPDPYGMGYLWAWAVPRDGGVNGWDLVTPQGGLVTEDDAIDFMRAGDEIT